MPRTAHGDGRKRARGGDSGQGPAADDRAALRPLDRSLAIALLRAREAVMGRFRPLLADHDLSDQQWRVIRVLAEASELDPTEISARCVILMPSLSRILRSLEARGLIVRERPEADGRRWIVRLTRRGRALFDAVSPRSEAAYREIERQFGGAALERLIEELHRLSRAGIE